SYEEQRPGAAGKTVAPTASGKHGRRMGIASLNPSYGAQPLAGTPVSQNCRSELARERISQRGSFASKLAPTKSASAQESRASWRHAPLFVQRMEMTSSHPYC